MRCYRVFVLGMGFMFDYITYGDITKEELKQWFEDNYSIKRFVRVKEIERSEIDRIWAVYLEKEDGAIKCI